MRPIPITNNHMTSHQRVTAALNHKQPDRVPINLFSADAYLLGGEPRLAELCDFLGISPVDKEQALTDLGVDMRDVGPRKKPGCYTSWPNRYAADPVRTYTNDGATYTVCIDGCERRLRGEFEGSAPHRPSITGRLTEAEINRVYPPNPELLDWAVQGEAPAKIEGLHKRGLAAVSGFLFLPAGETSQDILALNDWCIELALNPNMIERLMDRYLEHVYAYAESYFAAMGGDLDVIQIISDDVASQRSLWLSPADYRRYIKPRQAAVIRFVKERTNAKVMLHCCGACREIIGDFIDIGIDILSPLQTSAVGMDPFEIKREFGSDICFWGGIDTMKVLPHGSPQEVADAVKRHIDALAPGGGYVLGPSQLLQGDVPVRNIVTMYRTAVEYCSS